MSPNGNTTRIPHNETKCNSVSVLQQRRVKMGTRVDMDLFTAYLKARRGEMGLREAAHQIGDISPATLSRIENGRVPDMDVFLRLCDWIGLPPETVLSREDAPSETASTPEVIEAHLRADRTLDESTAEAIARMVKAAYELGQRKQHGDG
jgi:transcriptional regulator with XRE-family HTH domain